MYSSTQDRIVSALAALAIVLGGLAAIIAGLAANAVNRHGGALVAVIASTAPPPQPKPREKPAKAHSTAAKGRPSPANLHNRATQVVAPPATLPPLIVPPPIPTAPRAGTGSAAQNGASDHLGPGNGAGGIGDGDGGGGNGDGDGGYDDAVTRPRQIHGRLHFSDLPEDLREAKTGGELKLRYRIGVDGRVSDCRILVSSGRPQLDATTCRLITERFRFKPSRDASGRPVPAIMIENHGWYWPPEPQP